MRTSPPRATVACIETEPFYHAAILVKNIDEAVERFSAELGLTFAPILTTPLRLHYADAATPAGESEQVEVRWTFSRQGPPYIELNEGQEAGFFSLRAGERLHHIGRWVAPDNIDSAKRRLGEAVIVERLVDGPAYSVWFADPTHLHGIWLELVDDSSRRDFETWINSAQ